MFAPVQDLGLVAIWDDGDGSHSEQHAPQPHAREVLLLRAAHDKCGFLLGSTSCTVEAAQLVGTGWALPLAAGREQVRTAAPLVRTVGDGELARDEAARVARLPSLAWQVVREGLKQRPGAGAGAPARLCAPAGLRALPYARPLPRTARGRWRRGAGGTCTAAGAAAAEQRLALRGVRGLRLRAQVVGARRTAEELGRAFPAVPVRTSGRDHVLDSVPDRPALVVSTPGAEPVAEGGGYAAALLLDGWAMLGRPDLRAGEEALRRWMQAALAWCAATGRGRHGGRGRRADPAAGAGAGALGPGRATPCAELAERAELRIPAGVPDGGGDRAGRTRSVRSWPPPNCRGDAEVLGPVPLPVTDPGGRAGRAIRRRGSAGSGPCCGCRRAAGRRWRRALKAAQAGAAGSGWRRSGTGADRPAGHRLRSVLQVLAGSAERRPWVSARRPDARTAMHLLRCAHLPASPSPPPAPVGRPRAAAVAERPCVASGEERLSRPAAPGKTARARVSSRRERGAAVGCGGMDGAAGTAGAVPGMAVRAGRGAVASCGRSGSAAVGCAARRAP